MDQALNQKIDAFIAANKDQWLKDIETLVSINSVESAPAEGAPYGLGARAALDKTLELAAGMGFATRNCENHIGYAELPGADAEKYLATICHVDVVPEGNGWTGDPFKMEVRDGWLIGRGVADDKGPMITILYALKFLKEQGYPLRYPIRALVGDNEETSMQDVEYYLKNYPAPAFCFTPDAEFPVCNGEKGHFGAELVSPVCNGVIKEFVGGVANNAVPDRASALVETDITKLKNAPNITLEPEGTGVRIRGWGTSFLFVVVTISILLFALVSAVFPTSNMLVRMLIRLALLPFVVSISYECNRFVGRHDNALTRALSAPGMWFQHFTTNEPDDSMLEVAIEALKLVIPDEAGADRW